MMDNKKESARTMRAFPGLTYYHPNGSCTGTALRIELKLHILREDRYGCFFLEIARQKAVADPSSPSSYPTFDWQNKAIIKLSFLDVCAFLTVLEGRVDRLGPEGKGLFHQYGSTNTLITLQQSQKNPGFYLGISRKEAPGSERFKAGILLNDAEAIGLRSIFQAGLFHLAFGQSPVNLSVIQPSAIQQTSSV